jgi:hypothetical protein
MYGSFPVLGSTRALAGGSCCKFDLTVPKRLARARVLPETKKVRHSTVPRPLNMCHNGPYGAVFEDFTDVDYLSKRLLFNTLSKTSNSWHFRCFEYLERFSNNIILWLKY